MLAASFSALDRARHAASPHEDDAAPQTTPPIHAQPAAFTCPDDSQRCCVTPCNNEDASVTSAAASAGHASDASASQATAVPLAVTLARMRAAEKFLRAKSARLKQQRQAATAAATQPASDPHAAATQEATATQASEPSPAASPSTLPPRSRKSRSGAVPWINSALAWAFKCSAGCLLLLAAVVAAIVWNERATTTSLQPTPTLQQQPHQTLQLSRSSSSFQPSTSAFLLHLPLFDVTAARPTPKAVKPQTLSAEERQQREAHAWLAGKQAKEQEEKFASAAAASPRPLSPLASAAISRRLLCEPRTDPDHFPSYGVFSDTQLHQGAVILHLVFLAYLMLGWSVLWTNYVNPLARHIASTYGLHTNKGEATLLAIAGCLPNFTMNMFSVFYTKRDIGTGAVLGSGIMNTFVIPLIIFFGLPHIAFPVFWWRASRDLVCFSAAVLIMVAMTITGQQISLVECAIMFGVLFLYCYVLSKDTEMYRSLARSLYRLKKKKLREKRQGKKRSGLQRMLESDLFSNFITLCIMVSISFVIWDSVGEEKWLVNANYAISAIFLLESVLKHFCYGTLGYWSDPLHAFDGVLVILIMFELIFGNGAVATSVRAVRLFRFLRALRGLRAVRVYRNTAHKRKEAHENELFEQEKLGAAAAAAAGAATTTAAATTDDAPQDPEAAAAVAAADDDDTEAGPGDTLVDDKTGEALRIKPESVVRDAMMHPLHHADGSEVLAGQLPIMGGKPGSHTGSRVASAAASRRSSKAGINSVVSLRQPREESKQMQTQQAELMGPPSARRAASDAAVESPRAASSASPGPDGEVSTAAPAHPHLFVVTTEDPSADTASPDLAPPSASVAVTPVEAEKEKPRMLALKSGDNRRLTGSFAVQQSAGIALPPSPLNSARGGPVTPSVQGRMLGSQRGSAIPSTPSHLGGGRNVPGTGSRMESRGSAVLGTGSQMGRDVLSPGSMAGFAAGMGLDGTATVNMKVMVRESTDEETGEATEELIIIAGNAGATAEELALAALDDDDGQCTPHTGVAGKEKIASVCVVLLCADCDSRSVPVSASYLSVCFCLSDDDDDDDDDAEEEEDELDHWEEMLEEEDGRGPKGQVGERILDERGQPTGLIKVFVRGVEPRRWSAFRPKWNPYRQGFALFMICMMAGMTLLIISVNIKNQAEGKAV